MRVLLLNISDIHVNLEDRPENEGLVLRKFIVDVDTQVEKFTYNDVFVLISGDLVFAASDESYAKFDKLIVQELMRVLHIDRSHFIIAPGNHDVTQKTVKDVEDSFLPIFSAKYGERKFNDLIRKTAQKGIVFGKFDAFQRYMRETMGDNTYSLRANNCEINDTWSVHILNSAILSCGGYNNIDDQGHLGVDTRSLQQFLSEEIHPKKILLMHHPEYFCMDWVSDELRALYGSEYALVLSGHKHSKFIYCDKSEGYIRCEAPQLLTSKSDALGYNFIELSGDKVSRITYRQWASVGREFKVGTGFVRGDNNNGVIAFDDADTQPQAIDNGLLSNNDSATNKEVSTNSESNDSEGFSKVFVSYKREVDKDKVLPIVNGMESELGIKFWFDEDGIESDDKKIEAIKECKVFLYMYSKAHENIDIENDSSVEEIIFAKRKRKRIVWIELEKCEILERLDYKFPNRTVVRAADEDAMKGLVNDIRRRLRLPHPNPSPSHQGKAADTVSVPTVVSSHPQSEGSSTNKPHPQAIDLGLPSGTKWASCNVDDDTSKLSPTNFGSYYAWGETEEKDEYSWNTYIHCDGSKKTCHNLGRDIAGTQYDVAHVKWGGSWRMPTIEQIKELLANCNDEWATLNGVNGRKFTSKLNGNSIFLPAVGSRYDNDLNLIGSNGYSWSSSQDPSRSYGAYGLYFRSDYADCYYGSRCGGRMVRPVSKN